MRCCVCCVEMLLLRVFVPFLVCVCCPVIALYLSVCLLACLLICNACMLVGSFVHLIAPFVGPSVPSVGLSDPWVASLFVDLFHIFVVCVAFVGWLAYWVF